MMKALPMLISALLVASTCNAAPSTKSFGVWKTWGLLDRRVVLPYGVGATDFAAECHAQTEQNGVTLHFVATATADGNGHYELFMSAPDSGISGYWSKPKWAKFENENTPYTVVVKLNGTPKWRLRLEREIKSDGLIRLNFAEPPATGPAPDPKDEHFVEEIKKNIERGSKQALSFMNVFSDADTVSFLDWDGQTIETFELNGAREAKEEVLRCLAARGKQ